MKAAARALVLVLGGAACSGRAKPATAESPKTATACRVNTESGISMTTCGMESGSAGVVSRAGEVVATLFGVETGAGGRAGLA